MSINPFEEVATTSISSSTSTKPTSHPRTAHSYIARLEHDYLFTHKLTLCNNCFRLGTDVPMKRCQGCQLNDYCSRECQRARWKSHKPFCHLIQGKGAANAFLESFGGEGERERVFKIVIDSYRLRCEVDHGVRGEDHGIYSDHVDRKGGKKQKKKKTATTTKEWEERLVWVRDGDVVADFQRYIDLLEWARILPDWWGFEARMELMYLAIDAGNNENIYAKIDQDALIPRYDGDTQIRNALCVLAEMAVGYDGKGIPGDDGQWYEGFVKYLNEHPDEKEKALKETKETVQMSLKTLGRSLPEAGETEI